VIIVSEYKSVNKYLKKNNNQKKPRFLVRLLSKVLVCTVILLGILITLKIDKNSNQVIYKFLYEHNINFATINNIYQKYLGDILPFQNITKKDVSQVFDEKLKYQEANIYKDGVELTVEDSYLVPILESGIVVFKGEKEGYGKTVIIEQIDGTSVWYSNIDNINVKLYDYVNKGEFLAEAKKKLYLVFQKDGKYLDYKNYLK